MKRQIRRGVFETNSSSTHSLVICTKEEHDKWMKGELLLHDDYFNSKLISPDEAAKYNEDEIFDYDSWGEEYEQDVTEYKSPSGDDIVIRAYYGSEY